MCGITGYAGIENDQVSTISSMVGQIRHRGPDNSNYYLHEDLAIGMTRLSIVDISGGNQPMYTQNRRLCIVFNGEIYNHSQLAMECRSLGYRLKTESDTEVVLALYSMLKEQCLERLQGMFAFAILDCHEKSIFIARDRLGIKPLYFFHQGSKLLFSSEIKSLLASKQLKAEANLDSIADYLTLRYLPKSKSLFQGVQQLSPGSWIKWQGGELKQQSYWQPKIREKSQLSNREIQEEFNRLFEKSIDMHCMGEAPYGVYLSGGLDSTAILSALAKRDAKNIKTFTVGFGWEKDELKSAKETARLLGAEHNEVICSPNDIEHLPKIIWHSDEPLGDPIVLPAYLLAREASKKVKVVLTGEGADEILGGYLFHQAALMAARYRQWVPDFLHKAVIKLLIKQMPVRLLNTCFNYPGYLGNSGKQRLLSFIDLARDKNIANLIRFFITLFDANERDHLINNEMMAKRRGAFDWKVPASGTFLDKVLSVQYIDWLPNNILMRQDKMSMAHGVEARAPFLDHKLVEFMETVPDRLKLKLQSNKILLRKYLASNGLHKIARQKKSAFYFPMEQHFQSAAFQDLLNSTLSERQVKNRGLFDYAVVNRLIRRMNQKDFFAAKQVFSLVSLEIWFQIFIDQKFDFM